MEPLTNRELEQMFIETMMESDADEVHFGGYNYSKIEMIKDHDPVMFRQAFLEWLDQETDVTLFERDGEFYTEEQE